MLPLVVVCVALMASQSAGQDVPTWDSYFAPWLDSSWRDNNGGYGRNQQLEGWQRDKLQDYKELFGQNKNSALGIRGALFNGGNDEPWRRVQNALSPSPVPSNRYGQTPSRDDQGGDSSFTPPFDFLDDNLFSSFRPAGSQDNNDGSFSMFPSRRSNYGIDSQSQSFSRPAGGNNVIPFSPDFADRAYGSQIWRLPNPFLLPLNEVRRGSGRNFEDSVSDYYSSRRQYAFNLVNEVLRFCDCRDTRAVMKLWWGGLFNYDANVYREAVAAETYDDLGFPGQFGRDPFTQSVRGNVPASKTVKNFRMRLLKGLLDTVCESAKTYVAQMRAVVEIRPAYPRPLWQ